VQPKVEIVDLQIFARELGLDRGETDLILAHVLHCSRASVMAHAEREVPRALAAHSRKLFEARKQGEPIAYLFGEKEFYGLRFEVNASVLIPRPETELLVDTALAKITVATGRMLDLGTGSGAIACALAHFRPMAQVHATELDAAALALAKANAARLSLPIQFHQGSWFEALPNAAKFDLIVSNPPYIAEEDPHLREGDLRFEPRLALTPGGDGTSSFQEICENAGRFLVGGGWLMLEHGYDQGAIVRQLLHANSMQAIETIKDYSGHERISIGRLMQTRG
jgi:release factor glutamine methyltransferase